MGGRTFWYAEGVHPAPTTQYHLTEGDVVIAAAAAVACEPTNQPRMYGWMLLVLHVVYFMYSKFVFYLFRFDFHINVSARRDGIFYSAAAISITFYSGNSFVFACWSLSQFHQIVEAQRLG